MPLIYVISYTLFTFFSHQQTPLHYSYRILSSLTGKKKKGCFAVFLLSYLSGEIFTIAALWGTRRSLLVYRTVDQRGDC